MTTTWEVIKLTEKANKQTTVQENKHHLTKPATT
jgi:hypothetical protein